MNEKLLSILTGMLYVGFGFYLTFSPAETLYTMAFVIGVILTISGILNISNYFLKKSVINSNLLPGIIDLLFGILLMTNFLVTAATIVYIIGSFLLLKGLMTLLLSFKIKEYNKIIYKNLLINSILTLIFSIYLFMSPILTVLTITVMSGVFLMFIGFFIIMASFIQD